MEKDFDRWNIIAKEINRRDSLPFCKKREIWWCSLGVNIGSEEDGKHELFERPILILKSFNRNSIRIAPLTSKIKNDSHHVSIIHYGRCNSVILSHVRTISTKRLSRKISKLDSEQFERVINFLRENIS